MLLPFAAPSAAPLHLSVKLHNPLKLNHPPTTIVKKLLASSNLSFSKTLRNNSGLQLSATGSNNPAANKGEFRDAEIGEEGNGGDEGCRWEGAIVYKRNAAVSHLEYCTTLERLGLGKVSSEVSRNRASEMGLRAVRPLRDFPDGTPVLISVDVTRRKRKLRLDGIVRTVIALNCNRCCEPVGQIVYSVFSLLLCEQPIQEPDKLDMGVIFRQDKSKTEGDDEDDSIDFDDRLYFPIDKKTIDISKNIRDLIHVEITISAVCDPSCKGLCSTCDANLNIGKCTCKEHNVVGQRYGPLGGLRKQMQQS